MALEITDKKVEDKNVVFTLSDIMQVLIDGEDYGQLKEDYSDREIVSLYEEKEIKHKITDRELVYVSKESGIPLRGHIAFGLIDRGTNLIQARPITGCNLNCVFCSVAEGPRSKKLKTDYLVDPDYLIEELEKMVEEKGVGVEVHIDGQGEPGFYPWLEELAKEASKMNKVEVVSMQTNGLPFSKEDIEDLEPYLSRINLSLSSLDSTTAKALAAVKDYNPNHLKNIASKIVESDIDLLVAPVWLPDWNDEEMEKIIEYTLDLVEESRWPRLGLQKFISYRSGRDPKAEEMTFHQFYKQLRKWEEKYNVVLDLSPRDFNIVKRDLPEKKFEENERVNARIVAPGRKNGEMIARKRERSIAVKTDKNLDDRINLRITRTKHDIYHGVEE
ncbi:MAG: radical SAM protein [Candidatus Aenigmatarchaeota archaeon]